MAGLLNLAVETLDGIAAYIGSVDALGLARAHSALRGPAQRSIFRHVAFKNNDGQRYLQFILAIHGRPALGAYVTSFSILDNFLDLYHPQQLSLALGLLDSLWPHLPGLKHMHLSLPSLPLLTFEGCTDNLHSLSLPRCGNSAHQLVLRNRALHRLSLGEPAHESHACSFPANSLPHLRYICADTDTLLSLAPNRKVTHVKSVTALRVDECVKTAAVLSNSAGPIRKVYLPIFPGPDDDYALLTNLGFMAPFQHHFALLTSLSLAFGWHPAIGHDTACAICEELPTGLKALRTLRLWRPAPQNFPGNDRLQILGMNAEAAAVGLAHQRCPSLRHVSLFSRIDWHYVAAASAASGIWIPVVRGGGGPAFAASTWFHTHPDIHELLSQHIHELEAAETDSLLEEEPDQPVPHTPDSSTSDSDSDDEDPSFDDLMEELDGLSEEKVEPPAGLNIPQSVWSEMVDDLAHPNWASRSTGPIPNPGIAVLLDRIAEARRSQVYNVA